MAVVGVEEIGDPLTVSALSKKSLCDYVVNVATGCLHGCSFCYVPSTPVVRMRGKTLETRGVENPQLDWGNYLFIREDLPEVLERSLNGKRTWKATPAGQGVVLLCSGTDPYQNLRVANVTRAAIAILLKHKKRIRILTRSPLWTRDLDLLSHPDITIGMSIPHGDDALSRQIERNAPPPSVRLKAMQAGQNAGCRLFVAMAPTPPMINIDGFKHHLERLMQFDPEVIFWEPINGRGSNGERMKLAGLTWVSEIMSRKAWAENFLRQWRDLMEAAMSLGCADHIHVWTDPDLKGFVAQEQIEAWWYRPTPEKWRSVA